MIRVLLVAILACCSCSAIAQELFMSGGFGAPTPHAWMIIPERGFTQSTILHLYPPASGNPDAASFARQAGEFDGQPQFVASGGNRLFLVSRGLAGDRRLWRVFALEAVRSPIGNTWVTEPLDGLRVLPPIDSTTRPLDLCVAPTGLCTLIAEPESLSLRMLREQSWIGVELPADLARTDANQRDGLRLLGTRTSLLLLAIDSDHSSIRAWNAPLTRHTLARLDSERSHDALAPLAWDTLPATWESPSPDIQHAELRACITGEVVILAARDGQGTLWLSRATTGGGSLAFSPLGTIDAVESAFGVAGLGDRVLVAQLASDANDRGVRLREMTMADARLSYDGPPRLAAPLGRPEYLLLAMVLLELTACALVFILKPEGGEAIWLPEGFALAPGLRRLLAGSIDASLVLGATERVWLAFAPALLGEQDSPMMRSLAMILSSVALLILQGAVLETLFGRTLGKFIAGIRVIAPRSTARDAEILAFNPSPGQALLRNFIKWGLPPLGFLGLLDREGRNRGDQIAGTITVIRDEPDLARREDDDA